MYKLKRNEQETRERLNAFWNGRSIGRPAVITHINNPDYKWLEWTGVGSGETGKSFFEKTDFNPDRHVSGHMNLWHSKLYLFEEMPVTSMNFGYNLVLLAAVMGEKYQYNDNSAWIVSRENALDIVVPKFDKNADIIKKIEAVYEKLIIAAGEDAGLSPPPLLDGLTTLSMLHGPDKLCVSILEEPDRVKRLTYDMTTLYLDIYEHFYRFLGERGHTDGCTWLPVVSGGRMEAVQCDFSVMLSPDMFEEFVLPDLRRTTAYFENSLYHLDGLEQLRFIDMIASCPKINGIQWGPVPNVGWKAEDHIDDLKYVRSLGLSIYMNPRNIDDAVYITKKLGPDGLMFDLRHCFSTKEEAYEAVKQLEAAC